MKHAYYSDPEWLRKRSEAAKKQWADRKMRALLIKKQKALGYRSYGDGLYYSRKKI